MQTKPFYYTDVRFLWQWAKLYGVSIHIFNSWIKCEPSTAYLSERSHGRKRAGLTPKDCEALIQAFGVPNLNR